MNFEESPHRILGEFWYVIPSAAANYFEKKSACSEFFSLVNPNAPGLVRAWEYQQAAQQGICMYVSMYVCTYFVSMYVRMYLRTLCGSVV